MPELPEVETIVRELRSKILGEVFSGVELLWSRSLMADGSLPLIIIVSSISAGKENLFYSG